MYGAPNQMYYGGYQPQQVQKFASTLTEEEIEKLTKSASKFSLGITQEERARGVCNHRSADGMTDTLIRDELTGKWKCKICGYTFHEVDSSTTIEEISEVIKQVIDILQTTKLMFIDMPVETAREFYQIIPLLEKIPNLFDLAAKNLAKHETFGWNVKNPNMSAYSMFQNLNNLYGGGLMMGTPMGQPYMAPQQPYMPNMAQQPMGQPYAQQPFMNQPQMSMGYQPQSNGFMYNPAPTGYQPQTTGFAYQPTLQPATPTTDNVVATVDAKETPAEASVKQAIKA